MASVETKEKPTDVWLLKVPLPFRQRWTTSQSLLQEVPILFHHVKSMELRKPCVYVLLKQKVSRKGLDCSSCISSFCPQMHFKLAWQNEYIDP